jgi:cation:H+ antiporter
VVAGTVLARAADAIADATGLGRLLVGSVLLAGATSLPELTVGIAAVRGGMPDLAVGDLLGAGLMNVLILAVLDLSDHSRGKMLSRTAAAHALSGQLSIALAGLVGIGLLTTHRVPEWKLFSAHIWTWLLVVGYLGGLRLVFLDQRISAEAARQAHAQAAAPSGRPLWRSLVEFSAAATTIVIAGPYLAEAAGQIAELSGLGATFVGTTLVAVCTTLPELVTSLAALRLGAIDLCVGNVFGSNAFNMLLFWVLDVVSPGALFATVSPGHILSAVALIVANSVVIMGQLYQSQHRRKLIEPDAWLVILIVVGSIVLVYKFR